MRMSIVRGDKEPGHGIDWLPWRLGTFFIHDFFLEVTWFKWIDSKLEWIYRQKSEVSFLFVNPIFSADIRHCSFSGRNEYSWYGNGTWLLFKLTSDSRWQVKRKTENEKEMRNVRRVVHVLVCLSDWFTDLRDRFQVWFPGHHSILVTHECVPEEHRVCGKRSGSGHDLWPLIEFDKSFEGLPNSAIRCQWWVDSSQFSFCCFKLFHSSDFEMKSMSSHSDNLYEEVQKELLHVKSVSFGKKKKKGNKNFSPEERKNKTERSEWRERTSEVHE